MLRFYSLRLLMSENSRGPTKIIASIGLIKENNGNSRSSSSSIYSAHQHSPFMKKLLNKKGGKTTKKRWFEPHFKESLEFDGPKLKKGPTERHLTRLRQISHVLYDKVSHFVNSGELCQEILEKQVNITSVKLHNNMNGINVFWDADRSDWQVVGQLLDSKKGKLRSLLISYRVLGNIPPITFVKAKQAYNMSQLSHLLEAADYGPDYVPGLNPKEVSRRQREEEESSTSHQSVPVNDVPLHLTRKGEDKSQVSNHPNEVEFANSVMDFDGGECRAVRSEVSSQSVNQGQLIIQEGKNSTHTPNTETLNQNKDCNEDNHCDINITMQLNFRDDLYGLKRDDLLKKISAKKKGLPISEKRETPTISFKLNSVSAKNAVLVKELVNRKARKEEKKMKAKLLDRDASDFL